MMVNDEQFITLAARKLAGQATAAELQELDELLRQHEDLQERYFILQQYFRESAQHTSADTEQALQRTLRKIRQPQEIRTSSWKWIAAAAVVTGISIAIAMLWPEKRSGTGITAQTATDTAVWLKRQNGKATRAVIELADGSKIWLNADSKLTYPEVFGKTSREVYLSGEAFFNVAGSADRPFIVHLAKGMVRVLGTSFNVRAYDNEPVQTSVTTGKVAFIPKYENGEHTPDTFYITPDEKVIYRHNTDNVIKEVTSGEDDKAWTEGRLVFRDVSLEDICRELERTFGKKVTFHSDKPRQYRMTGSFQNNNLQEIMYYLAKSKSFKYTITDSLLLISE
jgi:ferric-dicitrate binding protein FerR (iron transport regulator)